jgi:hypothetical protein
VQVLKPDSVRCYGPVQLRAIALKLISGRECDTLLKVANLTIAAQDTSIKSQAKTIEKQELRYTTTEHLATTYLVEKEAIKKDLKKTKRRLIWTKVGWAFTSIILIITTVIASIK